MRKFKRCQPHSSPFGLFLVLAGASLLLTAVAPRANADPMGRSSKHFLQLDARFYRWNRQCDPNGSRTHSDIFVMLRDLAINMR